MKRSFLLFSLLVNILIVEGQTTTRTITLDYNIEDFKLHTSNGMSLIGSNTYTLNYGTDPTTPALPHLSVKILIGPDEYVSGFDISSTESLAHSNICLPHSVPCYPTSQKVTTNPFEEIVYPNASYPDSLVRFYGVHYTQGYKYAEFEVAPFTYKPEQKSLLINKIRISLSVMKTNNKPVSEYRESSFIKKMVVNPDDIETLYPNPIIQEIRSSSTNGIENVAVDYVIVTCDSLKDIFQELANWKIQKGVNTIVITVEDIYAQDATNDTSYIKIKRALDGYYDHGDGCKYIMLGGDVNVIPAYRCYVQLNNGSGTNVIAVDNTVADLFYSSFSNLDWNTINDSRNGDISDNIDPRPSTSIARLPVLNRFNASAIVQRIIDYEKGVNNSSWKNNILMFGGMLDDSFQYMPYKSTAHYFCDTIYACDISGHGIERFRFYDTDSDYPTGSQYEMNAEHLQTEMENGYHFIYGDTHGFTGSWTLENSGYFKEHAKVFNNPINTHFITNACHSNDYLVNCLSKSFFWNSDSGILSFFGSSVFNWINPVAFLFANSEYISHNYFHTLFSNNSNDLFNYRRIGDIVRQVKDSVITNQNINTYTEPYRWLLFSMNLLGDPEMPVFISTPQKQENISCEYSNGTLSIRSPYTPGNMAQICIMSLLDNGATYYYRSSIAYNPTFSLPDGEYSVCITHPGSIPYVIYIGKNAVHIQDKTLSGDMEVAAKYVYFGKNVLTNNPQGPVSIINGKTKVKATNSVTIKNDFEVQKGAEFSIEMQN